MAAPLTFKQKLRIAARTVLGLFDDNSLNVAHGLLGGIFPGAMGIPPYRGTREFLKAYSTMPWLRVVCNRIATSTAAVQWKLYVARKEPDSEGKRVAYRLKSLQYGDPNTRRDTIKAMTQDDELDEITDHPFLDMMAEGNAFHDGYNLRKITQICLETVGEAFWIKERNALSAPVAMWIVPPHWIINTPTPRHPFYRYSFRGWQGEIPETEVLHICDPNPELPYYRGSGTGMALSDELESDEYAARMQRQFFLNQARPDFAIWPKNNPQGDQIVKDSEVNRFEQDWLNKLQGMNRVFKPYFASREMGIHEFTKNLRELQFVELRKFERDTIIQTFGLPPELLGVIEHSNKATVMAADFLYSRWCLTPRLEFLRAMYQHRLIPEYDDRLIVDFESPVQEDREFQLAAAAVAPWALSIDEWRELCGHDHLDDDQGDAHMVPFNISPVRDFNAPPKLPPGGKPGGGGNTPKPANPIMGYGLLRNMDLEDREVIRKILEKAAANTLVAK